MNRRTQHFSIRRWRAAMREDSGVSAILIAIMVVLVVIPISAIAVDLSHGYANRRQMQNAADAASMAATDALSAWRAGGSNTLQATAVRVADSNGNANVAACELVNVTYTSGTPVINSVGACTDSTWGTANGVRVTTDRDVSTFFAPALPGGGPESTSAGANATASLQKVVGGWAPFALCAYWDRTPPDSVVWPGPETLKVLLPDGSINPAAVGLQFPVWGNGNQNSKCGLGDASWKGTICGFSKVDAGACELTIPGEVRTDTGARVGPVLTTVAGEIGCTPATIPDNDGDSPCTVALPICSQTVAAKTLYCDTWGAFELSYSKTTKAIMAELLGAATLTGATGGAGPIGDKDAVVIGLVG